MAHPEPGSDMSSEHVQLSLADGIATVTLNRPERRNALHPAAHHALAAVFDRLAQDASVRVVIVRGSGGHFCAGYDLKDNLNDGEVDLPATGFGGLTWRSDYPLPVVAAVQGMALGGGFELALACDLIVASSDAQFALPEPKVGWAALGGGLQRLPRAIGTKRAMGIILTGRFVPAEEALQLGIVNQVVAAEQLDEAALAWARQIATCAPLAIRCSKQVAYASLDQPDFAQALNPATYPCAAEVLNSADALEGRRAFSEKRAPVWRGQ